MINKILNPYRFYRGSKGGDAPWPALVPPQNQALLKSISITEIVDLLCEGPVYGLVDQFGRKIYGLDMLKGVYLNKIPIMNYDGKYNFRNVVMEMNLGTENQKPLTNFKEIYIFRPANFKLLGPILGEAAAANDPLVNRPDPNGGAIRNFESWAAGWPKEPKDPFVFVHHVKNRDVKKIKISLLVEALYDTIDVGTNKGEAGRMGMSRSTNLTIAVAYGTEGTNSTFIKEYTMNGTVTSPYACMLGEQFAQFDFGNYTVSDGVATGGGGGGGAASDNSTILTPKQPLTFNQGAMPTDATRSVFPFVDIDLSKIVVNRDGITTDYNDDEILPR